MSRSTDPVDQVADVDLPPGRHVEYQPLSEILTAEINPRDHDIPRLVGAIRRFGFTVPPLRDERTGRLVAGHGRLLALSEMRNNGELSDLVRRFIDAGAAGPGVRVDLPPGILVNPHTGDWMPRGVRVDDAGGWLVPVVCGWSSTSDAEARAYLVADNRMTELARWEQRGFVDLLSAIKEDDPDLLDAAGYTDAELAAMDKALEPSGPDDDDGPDDFQSYDPETIKTEHECPSCGYRFSGSAKSGGDD